MQQQMRAAMLGGYCSARYAQVSGYRCISNRRAL